VKVGDEAKAIIDENQVIVLEDLNVKGFIKIFLVKSISNSGWAQTADYNPVKSFIYFFYAAPCFRA